MNLISPVIAVELLATIVAFIFFSSLKKGKLRTLPFFLLFISAVELFGRYLQRIEHVSNIPLYNISIPIEYLYYYYIIGIHGEKSSCICSRVLSGILISVSLYRYFAFPITEFKNFVLLTGQFSTILLVFVYIIDSIRSDSELQLLQYTYFVWIAGGLLVFNLGDLVYVYLIPVTNRLKWDEFGLVFTSINNKLNYALYVCYVMAVIIYWKKKKSWVTN